MCVEALLYPLNRSNLDQNGTPCLHLLDTSTSMHGAAILIHARPTCTIYETQKGPFAHRTVRWALPDGDSHLPGGPSYELTTRSRVRAISRGPGAGRGDCPRCFCSAPISVGEWQRCAKLRLLCTTNIDRFEMEIRLWSKRLGRII